MATYIAFIATLNLCIGYALGVYIGKLPGLTPRERGDADDEEPIVLKSASSAPQPSPLPPSVTRPAFVASPPTGTTQPTDGPPQVEYAQIVEGLAAFKSKLATVSAKLRDTSDDRAEIDKCASELKEANNEYLEQTTAAIDQMSEDATGQEQQLRDSLASQSDEILRTNEQIDEILTQDDTVQVREQLIASSDQLVESTTVVEQALPATLRQAETETSTKAPTDTESQDLDWLRAASTDRGVAETTKS